jgi:hypothetical protein
MTAPTQITFGRFDQVTSTRFADRLKHGIRHSKLLVFDELNRAVVVDAATGLVVGAVSILAT